MDEFKRQALLDSGFAQRLLEAHGCRDFTLELDGPEPPFAVEHDDRGAPFSADKDGLELSGILYSFSDEKEHALRAWARPPSSSPIVGLGIDLASTDDFDDRPVSQHFIRLLFTDREHELVRELWPGRPHLGYAAAFAAREAAFKATSQPLRRWYNSHDEALEYEVRHFSLVAPDLVRGEQRDAAAQHAMDAMGIDRIELAFGEVEGMAVACAIALSSRS